MRRIVFLAILVVTLGWPALAQTQDVKLPADTLTIQAEATYEADPDVANLNFQVSA